jgi:hypothetical protein
MTLFVSFVFHASRGARFLFALTLSCLGYLVSQCSFTKSIFYILSQTTSSFRHVAEIVRNVMKEARAFGVGVLSIIIYLLLNALTKRKQCMQPYIRCHDASHLPNHASYVHLHSVGGELRDLADPGERVVLVWPENLHPAMGTHLTLVSFAFARGVLSAFEDLIFFCISSGRP